MVFASVRSKPQLMAAMSKLERLAKEDFDREAQNHAGGSPWECLDFGDTVVHVMSEEQVRSHERCVCVCVSVVDGWVGG